MKIHQKKSSKGLVLFADGHLDKAEVAVAVNEVRKTAKATATDIHYMYSDVERGRYGIGRRFFVRKEKGSVPVSVWLPQPLQLRT